jgi:hypothetical protein
MAADYSVETGQEMVVVYTANESMITPLLAVSARFWARNLAGDTVLGGPASIQDPVTGELVYTGTAPTTPGELLARFTVTYSDGSTKSFPFPGAIVIDVLEPNPTRPIYAGLGDLEAALGRPIPDDQRGYALYLLSAATVAIDNHCCQSFTTPVPDEVRLACAGMAADSYGQGASVDGSGSGPVVAETIGDYSVRYADPGSKSASSTPSVYGFEFMLKRYRLCGATTVSTVADKTDPYLRRDGDYYDILRPESDL